MGVWRRNFFVSPLLATEIFFQVWSNMLYDPKVETITLDESKRTFPYAQPIVCAGLRNMTKEDFGDANYNTIAVGNAVGFC